MIAVLKIMVYLKRSSTWSFAALLTFVLAVAPLLAAAGGEVFTDPGNASQWTVLGPNGGDVRSVEIDPKNKDHILISTLDGQVYTSENAGKSWRLLARFDRPQLVLDQLLFDSEDSSVIYTSGHRGTLPGGFFRSTDGGKTWHESKDLRNEAVYSMTQSSADPKVLYVGTKTGIFISNDKGDDWEKLESETMPLEVNSMAVDPGGTTLYAGTTYRPYKSTDSGKTWRLIREGMIDDSDVFAITIDPRNKNRLVASACSGIYQSFNGGENWSKAQGIPSTSRRTRDILQHPAVPGTIFAATTQGFWMSADSGKTWKLTTPRTVEVNSVAVHPDQPERVFIGTNDYGVLVSNDGGKSFAPSNFNFTSRFIYSITPDESESNRLYALSQNTSHSGGFFFYSADGGTSWTQARGLDVNRDSLFSLLQDRKDPKLMYLGTNAGLFKSVDRGVSWTQVTAPKPVRKAPARKAPVRRTAKGKAAAKAPVAKKAAAAPAASPGTVIEKGQELVPVLTERINVLAHTDDDKDGIFAGTDSGLYRTYDISKGWEKITFGEGISTSVYAVAASPLTPGTIWVGTGRSGVITSTDSGETWAKAGGAPEQIPVSSIVIDPKRPNNIYVGTIHSLYLSRDGGRTWKFKGSGLPLGNYTSILIDPRDPDQVIVSSSLENDGGVFTSSNAGESWKRVDSKDLRIPSRRVWMMAFDPTDPDRIYAGSHSSGVYVIERNAGQASAAPASAPTAAPNAVP